MSMRRFRTDRSRGGNRAVKSLGRTEHAAHQDRAPVEQREVIAPELTEIIEVERDNLAKADSVLGCLVIAMEYGADSIRAPYYPDVAQIARDLVQQSLRGLDAVNLSQRLRDHVKDEIHVGLAGVSERAYAPPLLTSAASSQAWRCARGLRVHRRDYGRARKQFRVHHVHSTF